MLESKIDWLPLPSPAVTHVFQQGLEGVIDAELGAVGCQLLLPRLPLLMDVPLFPFDKGLFIDVGVNLHIAIVAQL